MNDCSKGLLIFIISICYVIDVYSVVGDNDFLCYVIVLELN